MGMCARLYDTVSNATVLSDELAELTLNVAIVKTNQSSSWSKELSEAQAIYAVIDAGALLELYQVLVQISDLSWRFSKADVNVGVKVDVTPLNGHVACMVTWASTSPIVERDRCECEQGLLHKNKKISQGWKVHVHCKEWTNLCICLYYSRVKEWRW